MFKKIISAFLIAVTISVLMSCTIKNDTKVEMKRSEASMKLQKYLEEDPKLMAMMEKSINKAYEINSDPNTNPVSNINELYNFIDWNVTSLPYKVLSNAGHPAIYDQIDQSVDYIWFLLDQPLEELEGKGYYYPTLQYHEPIASWCYDYAENWGKFLSTEESWNDEYYERIKKDPSMNMQYGWYGDTNKWKTFNEWFARYLIDPSMRPISDAEVVAPADSTPEGIWRIDEYSNLVQHDGVDIKAANFTSIPQLLGPNSKYGEAFAGGTLTHTFLDVNDYHRYHFPVSGKIVEVNKIKGNNAAGGVTIWDEKNHKYKLIDNIPGWQMIETRDCVVVDTEEYGLVAILPIGMSQICSCNFEDSVKVGAKVNKGDPMGYFLFGGSDIVMVFQKDVKAEMLCPMNDTGDGYKHIFMGEGYMKLSK